MNPREKRIDAYISGSAEFAKPVLQHLRELVHRACPDVQETIKWGFPNFEYHGILCSMASFKQHCSFGFWKASLMEDYEKRISPIGKTAMGNFGKITSLKDLPPDRLLLKYIKEACRLNKSGAKVLKPKVVERKALVVPPDFKKALAKNKLAKSTFDGFSYSNKKDYVEWITEAKAAETRAKRMETTIIWLSEGKIRNWKYVR